MNRNLKLLGAGVGGVILSEIPETLDVGDSQNSMQVTLVKMPNNS